MSENQRRILQMLSEGRLTVNEAQLLLDNLSMERDKDIVSGNHHRTINAQPGLEIALADEGKEVHIAVR